MDDEDPEGDETVNLRITLKKDGEARYSYIITKPIHDYDNPDIDVDSNNDGQIRRRSPTRRENVVLPLSPRPANLAVNE